MIISNVEVVNMAAKIQWYDVQRRWQIYEWTRSYWASIVGEDASQAK